MHYTVNNSYSSGHPMLTLPFLVKENLLYRDSSSLCFYAFPNQMYILFFCITQKIYFEE